MPHPLTTVIREIVRQEVAAAMDDYFSGLASDVGSVSSKPRQRAAAKIDERYMPIPDEAVKIGQKGFIKLNGFVPATVKARDGDKWVVLTANGSERRSSTIYDLHDEELPVAAAEVDPDAGENTGELEYESEDDESKKKAKQQKTLPLIPVRKRKAK